MIINIDRGPFEFDLFYQAAFIFLLVFYVFEGYKRKFNWSSWLLLILTTRIFGIIGSKIGGLTFADIQFFRENLTVPFIEEKNLIGALLAGILIIPVAKYLLKIKYPILDAFAVAVPLGMAIQRLGCLFGGCCYGLETTMPWGIHFLQHGNIISPALHPVPLYYIISGLLIAGIVYFAGKKFKRAGNTALFSLMLISLSRFIIDFFRSPFSESNLMGISYGGMFIAQWISIAAVIILAIVIYFREKNFHPVEWEYTQPSPLYEASYLVGLVALIYFARNWFTVVDFWMLMIVLAPTIILITKNIFQSYLNFYLRISTLLILFLGIGLSSQSIPDSTNQSVRIAFTGGHYVDESFCGNYYGDLNYMGVAGGYSKYFRSKIFTTELGSNFFISNDSYNSASAYYTTHNTQVYGFNPFVKFNQEWMGIGLGGTVGNFKDIASLTATTLPLLPMLEIRVFPEKYFYLKYQYGEFFPYLSSKGHQLFEIGSGFGSANKFKASLGMLYDEDFALALAGVKLKFPLDKKIFMQTSLYFGGNNSIDYQLSAGLHYYFGDK